MHFPVLLRALNYSTQELLNYFYATRPSTSKRRKFSKSIEYELLAGQRARATSRWREVVVRKHQVHPCGIKRLKEANLDRLPIELTELVGKVSPRTWSTRRPARFCSSATRGHE